MADTAEAVALKVAVATPALTVTDEGTWSALPEEERFTTVEVVAALDKDTKHAVVIGPVKLCEAQETLLKVGVAAG